MRPQCGAIHLLATYPRSTRSLKDKPVSREYKRVCPFLSSALKCIGFWRHNYCSKDFDVKNIANDITGTATRHGVDMVDLMEEMLFQRAASGIRPVLYVSSDTDLECSMLMLLDDMDEVHWSVTQQKPAKHVGYHMVTN